jgi:hypothetical protein
MQVRDLLNALVGVPPDTEVVLVKVDGHDNPFTDGNFTISKGRTNEMGDFLDKDDEEGDSVILIG